MIPSPARADYRNSFSSDISLCLAPRPGSPASATLLKVSTSQPFFNRARSTIIFMIRIRVFWALPIAMVWACTCFGQTGDVFTEPHSTLLFSPPSGTMNYGHRPLLFRPGYDETNYGHYAVVTPGGNFTVALSRDSDSMGLVSPMWAISPSGDRIAGGISFMLNVDVLKCDPRKPTWCDPHPRPIVKNVLGVYSVRDKTWKHYGDFEVVGSAAFSSDGERIAFYEKRGFNSPPCDEGLIIVDLETDQMRTI